jgi:hypothetical protein
MPGMSEPNAAGRKTDNDALDAVVELMKQRIDIQQARLAQAEAPPQNANPVIAQLLEEQRHRIRKQGDGVRPDEALTPPSAIALQPEVFQPDSTKALLNAQLLECVGLMREAGWLYRNSRLEPHDRGCFVSQTVNLMEASTKMGDAIRRLAGGEEPVPTTRHVMVVERVEGGGGKASLENE